VGIVDETDQAGLAGAFGKQVERGDSGQETVLARARSSSERTVQRPSLDRWQLIYRTEYGM
jgi:hypothetical protein